MRATAGWLCVCLASFVTTTAGAHKSSDSYLSLSVVGDTIDVQWDIALRDLDYAIGLDLDGDGTITWGELRARHDSVSDYALTHLQLRSSAGACSAGRPVHLVDEHTDGAYAVLRFAAKCPAGVRSLEIDYSLLFDLDPQHRGLARVEGPGTLATAVFGPQDKRKQFDVSAPARWRQASEFVREGMWHIWIGFDHILFLLTLLLPAVLRRRAGSWQSTPDLRASALTVAGIVTAFTLAHSLTLSLGALNIVALPSRLVESAIAASVVVAALNNLIPIVSKHRWLVAFGFGLIHGLGFAGVLSDLGLPPSALALALFAFNVGVEIGQLAIVAVFLPAAHMLRHHVLYRRIGVQGGSLAAASLAMLWLVERAFDIRVIVW